MALTPKQEKFCKCVADGMAQAEAYRAAYNAGNMKDETVWSKASVLMKDGKVAARVAELRAQLEKRGLWSREQSVNALMAAYEEGSPAVKVSAVKELNAMHGYNAPQKIDLTSTDGSMTPRPPLDVSKLSDSTIAELLAARDSADK